MTEGRGRHLSLTHPADGVDGLRDVAAVDLCQFPAQEQGRVGAPPAPRPACPAPTWLPALRPLRLLLVFLPRLGLRDTVVAFPVQNLLQFLLLPGGAVGEEEGSVAGLGALPLSRHQGAPPSPPIQGPVPSPVIHLLQPLDLSVVSIQDNLPEPLQSLWTRNQQVRQADDRPVQEAGAP